MLTRLSTLSSPLRSANIVVVVDMPAESVDERGGCYEIERGERAGDVEVELHIQAYVDGVGDKPVVDIVAGEDAAAALVDYFRADGNAALCTVLEPEAAKGEH